MPRIRLVMVGRQRQSRRPRMQAAAQSVDKPNCIQKPYRIASQAAVALKMNMPRHRALGFRPKPRKGVALGLFPQWRGFSAV